MKIHPSTASFSRVANTMSVLAPRQSRKSSLSGRILAAALLAVALVPSSLKAATFTYSDGGGTFNWGEGANWVGGVAPGNGQDLVWVAGILNPETSLNQNFPGGTAQFLANANSITFNLSATVWNLNVAPFSAFTINGGGITNNNTNQQNIGGTNGIVLGAAEAFTSNGGLLNVTAAVNLNGQTLTVAGAGNTTLGGVVSGAGGLIKNAGGTLTVTNPLTVSTGATLNAGNVVATGGLNVTGGMFTGSGTLTGSLNYSSISPGSTFAGTIAGGASTVTVGTGAPFVSNVLHLTGTNTYGGATTVNQGGLLEIQSNGALSGSGATVASGGSLDVTNNVTTGAGINVAIAGTGVNNTGALRGGGFFPGTNNTFSGNVTLNADASIAAVNSSTLNIGGAINLGANTATFSQSGGGGGIINTNGAIGGTGGVAVTQDVTVNLNATGTYTGGTAIANGTVNVNANNGAGTGPVTINSTDGATQGLLNIATAVTQNVSGVTINAPNSSSTAITGAGTLALNGDLSVVNSTTSPGNAFATTINVATIAMGGGNRAINVQGQNLGIPDLNIQSAITGTGGFTVNATASTATNALATVSLSGAAANTNTGLVTVNTGNLLLNGPTGTNKIAGDVTIGDGLADPVSGTFVSSARVTLGALSMIANTSNMTINPDGQFNMNSFGESIHNLVIDRGNVTNVPTNGINSLALFGTLDMTGGSITGGLGATPGLLLLGANSDVTATSDATGNAALIASNVSLGGITRTFTVNDGPGAVDLDVTGVVQDATAGLIKEGAGLMRLTNTNTYGGNTTINDGELQLDGSIASPLTTVNVGGTLSGIGIVGGNLVNNGTVSPGDSPGTLAVNGNYTQSTSGNLIIEIAGLATHDLLAVGGAANLDGTVTFVKLANFPVVLGDKIIFLTANGGVNGEFATTVTSDFDTGTLVTPEVIYEANDVALLFAQGSFVIGGLTPNQTAVAVNLNNSVGDPRADALINFLDTEQLANLPHDYDLIAPEELAALYEISFAKAIVQNVNIQHRTDDIRAGSSGFSSNGMNMTTSGSVLPDPGLTFAYSDGKVVLPVDSKDKNIMTATPENRWGVFVTGSGDFVNVNNNDDNAHGYDITTGTVLVGLDYRVCDHFAIGIDGSYSGGRANLVDDGRIDMDGGQAGAYATVYGFNLWGSVLHFDAGVSGGWNDYDTRRTGLQNLSVRGSTDGSELNAFVAYGGDWHFGRLLVGTWSSFQYTDVNINDFTETGSLAPLHFPDQDEDSVRSSTGLRLAYEGSCGNVTFRPEVRAAWEHEYGDRAYPIDARFASGAGGIFTVHGPAIGRDSALVDAGLTVLWNKRVSSYIFYDGNLGRSNYDNNAVSGGFRVTF